MYGGVKDIRAKVVELTTQKAKRMPVIIFCSDINSYKELLLEAKVFAGDNIGRNLAILESLQSSKSDIVLTTSAYSKGVDFKFEVPQAYVIHAVLPTSVVQLR